MTSMSVFSTGKDMVLQSGLLNLQKTSLKFLISLKRNKKC